LVGLFEDAQLAAIHATQVTIQPKYMQLTRWIRKEGRPHQAASQIYATNKASVRNRTTTLLSNLANNQREKGETWRWLLLDINVLLYKYFDSLIINPHPILRTPPLKYQH
jgi:hypothetical protein